MKASWALAALQGAASLALFALSYDPECQVWQPPAGARDLLALSRTGFVFACGLYLAASAWALGRTRRPLAPRVALAVLAVPYAFNWLWILVSPSLAADLGRMLAFGSPLAPWAAAWLGRSAVLAVFNAAVCFGIGFAIDRRGMRGAGAVWAAARLRRVRRRDAADRGRRRRPPRGHRHRPALAGGALGADPSRHRSAARRARRAASDPARGALARAGGPHQGSGVRRLLHGPDRDARAGAGRGRRSASGAGARPGAARSAALPARAEHRRELRRQRPVLPPARGACARAGEPAARPGGRGRDRPRAASRATARKRLPALRLRPAGRAPRPTPGWICSAMPPPSRAAGAAGCRHRGSTRSARCSAAPSAALSAGTSRPRSSRS